jgi:Flp pilus assembly protein TadD
MSKISTFVLVAIAILPYANTFNNDFVGYDDQNLVQNSREIRSLAPSNIAHMFVPRTRGNYQPIRTLSYAVDYALFGARPFGFHLANVLLHALTVMGVWLLIRRLMSEPIPFLTALIFAVHPIHVESVTWMSARKDVLSLAFFLLAILAYEKSGDRRGHECAPQPPQDMKRSCQGTARRVPTNGITDFRMDSLPLYLASILLTGLALLSKLTALSLPLCILLFEVCRDGWPKTGELVRKLVRLSPHALLACAVVGLNFMHFGAASSHGDALAGLEGTSRALAHDIRLSMPLVVCRYIGLLFVPYGLVTHYDVAQIWQISDPRAFIPIAALTAMIVSGVLCFLRGRRAQAFGIGWFVVTFLPTSNLFPTASMMNDRYMHIPSIGFALLLAMTLSHPVTKMSKDRESTIRMLMIMPAVIVVLLFSVLTIRRNADWRDTTTLFTRTLRMNPKSVQARLTLGAMSAKAGDYDSAIRMYRDALEIEPGDYRVLYNLSISYQKKGLNLLAIKTLEESRASNPDFVSTRFNLAVAYHERKLYEQAIAEHKEVLRLSPTNAASHGDLGRIYSEIGDMQTALKELNLALSIKPDLIPALIDRANLLVRQGRREEAGQDFQRLEALGVKTRDLRRSMPTSN